MRQSDDEDDDYRRDRSRPLQDLSIGPRAWKKYKEKFDNKGKTYTIRAADDDDDKSTTSAVSTSEEAASLNMNANYEMQQIIEEIKICIRCIKWFIIK